MDVLELVTAILFLIVIYLLLKEPSIQLKVKKIFKAKIDERHIITTLNDPYATPEELHQSISSLTKLSETLSTPRPDMIKLILNVMIQNNNNPDIQNKSLKCLTRLKRNLDEIQHHTLLENVMKVTLAAMETFPGDLAIQKNCLPLLQDTENVSFDKWNCLKLLLNTLSIIEDENETEKVLKICDTIFYSIPKDELDTYADTSDNWKETWNDVIADKELTNMRQTLGVLWNVCALPSRNDENIFYDFQLFTEMLEEFSDDHVTLEGVLGILHNISCKKMLSGCFMEENLIVLLLKCLNSSEFRLSFSASKIIVKLIYFVGNCWPDDCRRDDVIMQLKMRISNWQVDDIGVLQNSKSDFNSVLKESGVIRVLVLYSEWFESNLHKPMQI